MAQRRFWSLRPSTAREVAEAIFANFLLHWFPARMRASSLAWLPTFWLGTVTWVLFVVLLLSGLPLMVFYIPSVEDAYRSVKDIEHVVSFGWWLRAVHRLGAHLMVITVTLHLARVFLTGAYKNPPGGNERREWNWVIGVAMLFSTLLLSFTGYLLPWDQLAYWAVTVGTSIVSSAPAAGAILRETLIGGREIGEATLVRFYLLHIVVLPLAVAVLFGYHMWRVRKDGGLAHGDGDNERADVPAIPPVVRRIAVVTMATLLTVTVLAILIPSPLLEPANPDVTPNPAKAPWYFLWLQEVVTETTVRLGPVRVNGALVGGVILPLALSVLLTLWPWLDRSPAGAAGVAFPRERRAQNAVFLAIALAIAALTVIGLMRGPSWGLWWPWESWPAMPTRL
ncbi:MAG TPA: cytochrome bc complex cytochrome b subunit [Vicinamibacterales bacterium]|nr:cytochrome bc complex cytochrome b subunit [Vicinamibacterales bacterium]